VNIKREEGLIYQSHKDKRYGFIFNAKKQQVFFAAANVRPDSALSKAWAFIAHGSLAVTYVPIQRTAESGKVLLAAEDVAKAFPFEEPVDLEGLRETMIVDQIIHDYGFVVRPDGDQLFIHVQDVLEQYRARWSLLQPGVPIYAGVKMGANNLPRATAIELFSEAELRGEQPEPEPEPKVFNPALTWTALEPKSELLQSAFRSKSILQIISEKNDAKRTTEANR
jgi:hypothetical protein